RFHLLAYIGAPGGDAVLTSPTLSRVKPGRQCPPACLSGTFVHRTPPPPGGGPWSGRPGTAGPGPGRGDGARLETRTTSLAVVSHDRRHGRSPGHAPIPARHVPRPPGRARGGRRGRHLPGPAPALRRRRRRQPVLAAARPRGRQAAAGDPGPADHRVQPVGGRTLRRRLVIGSIQHAALDNAHGPVAVVPTDY